MRYPITGGPLKERRKKEKGDLQFLQGILYQSNQNAESPFLKPKFYAESPFLKPEFYA